MNRWIALLLAVMMTLSLADCAGKNEPAGSAEPAGTAVSEEEGQNPMMNFVGNYTCDRAAMLVEAEGSENAKITVTWGSSAWEHSEWTMSGKLDTETLTVDYTDCVRRDIVYNEDGTIESETVVYENGAGTITFSAEDYSLTWDDAEEHAADGMIFVGGAE